MLKAIACYYDGDNPSAISLLETVVDVEPNNVTARAMLALSHGHNGAWPTYIHQMMEIQETNHAPERKDYESLILGCALLYIDTERSLGMLKETTRRRPEWVVARAMLGGAKAHRALELMDISDATAMALAKEARQETTLAQQVLPDNRVVALYNVWAHRVAIFFARKHGEDYRDLLDSVEPSLTMLRDRHAQYTAGAYNVATFYEVIGEYDTAIGVLEKALGGADHDAWTRYYMGLLVQCGRLDEALSLLDSIPSDSMSESVRFAKAAILATIPERQKEAKTLCDSLLDAIGPTEVEFPGIQVLCLLGEEARVRSEAEKRLAVFGENIVANWMPKKALTFHTGKSIEEFDKDCGSTPIGRMEFHYHVALRRLSESDRAAAIRHFEECAQSSLIDSNYQKWALAFLRLLADNPDWPTKKNLQDR